jgi:hypothetical protein
MMSIKTVPIYLFILKKSYKKMTDLHPTAGFVFKDI